MIHLQPEEKARLERLLKAYFMLPYFTSLHGKDAEAILRLVKGGELKPSKSKELFDIVDGVTGYSVKTLRVESLPLDTRSAKARPKKTRSRVDLQEQRLCDVEEMRRLLASGDSGRGKTKQQGEILLSYMQARITSEMARRNVKRAMSLVLLKNWDAKRRKLAFRYWEEDFRAYIDDLVRRDEANEIEWVRLERGLHGRDLKRRGRGGDNLRLLRMHDKHNQIFTDHDIPEDAAVIEFEINPYSMDELLQVLEGNTPSAEPPRDASPQLTLAFP